MTNPTDTSGRDLPRHATSASYDKYPYVPVSPSSDDCSVGWQDIRGKIQEHLQLLNQDKVVMIVETYHGVHDAELIEALQMLSTSLFVETRFLLKSPEDIDKLMNPYLGDHPVFGRITDLTFAELCEEEKIHDLRTALKRSSGLIIVFGIGASTFTDEADVVIYADMARWEIQQRMRRNEIGNIGVSNEERPIVEKYKRAYFIDWRICDQIKKALNFSYDYLLDTNVVGKPKMITGTKLREGLRRSTERPFRVVPFFDPGVWGGQWMKEVCDLDRDQVNYAWCFDCVPEENSLLLGFGSQRLEVPAINLVFFAPEALLGEEVFRRFGAEFPIRFDFLDTMGGGNLSLQVHPMQTYMQEHFGIDYTQDESYYLLDVGDDAVVYLGLKEGVDRVEMMDALARAEKGDQPFPAEDYVNRFSVSKHDHVLIPAGTIHCSGRNSMVLEISATPYIFTFKLWDWGRVDLNGKPRPISLEHGRKNIQWDRDTNWVQGELIARVEQLASGDGWTEERTGLHESEFIETRRHWFTKPVAHHTNGNLQVINLVEGKEIIVESPNHSFEPFIVHYAETFIVPASVGAYVISPHGAASGARYATLKAFVRSNNS